MFAWLKRVFRFGRTAEKTAETVAIGTKAPINFEKGVVHVKPRELHKVSPGTYEGRNLPSDMRDMKTGGFYGFNLENPAYYVPPVANLNPKVRPIAPLGEITDTGGRLRTRVPYT